MPDCVVLYLVFQHNKEKRNDTFENTDTYLEFKDFTLAKGSLDVAVALSVGPGQSALGSLHVVVLLVHL